MKPVRKRQTWKHSSVTRSTLASHWRPSSCGELPFDSSWRRRQVRAARLPAVALPVGGRHLGRAAARDLEKSVGTWALCGVSLGIEVPIESHGVFSSFEDAGRKDPRGSLSRTRQPSKTAQSNAASS